MLSIHSSPQSARSHTLHPLQDVYKSAVERGERSLILVPVTEAVREPVDRFFAETHVLTIANPPAMCAFCSIFF